jgi:hypothetical protein
MAPILLACSAQTNGWTQAPVGPLCPLRPLRLRLNMKAFLFVLAGTSKLSGAFVAHRQCASIFGITPAFETLSAVRDVGEAQSELESEQTPAVVKSEERFVVKIRNLSHCRFHSPLFASSSSSSSSSCCCCSSSCKSSSSCSSSSSCCWPRKGHFR